MIYEGYLTQQDRKIGTENLKILLFIDHC